MGSTGVGTGTLLRNKAAWKSALGEAQLGGSRRDPGIGEDPEKRQMAANAPPVPTSTIRQQTGFQNSLIRVKSIYLNV